ncbi:MAG: putative teichuronic acid biosynthesis glycosyltransferase TuaC [Promethearchaeota archaeon]|nr:MAG: putative teichuronic acid biosynthesis glycosyltransferase TuaC [Candidatus Lokiarchaeota archaeon]
MNLIRISTRIFPDKGGPAKQAFLLSQYSAKNLINTMNIASLPKSLDKAQRTKINSNFQIYYLPFHAPEDDAPFITKFFFFLKFSVFSFMKILKIRKKHNIDIIHAHSPIPSGYIAYICFKLFHIPYVFTMHGLDYPNSLFLNTEINLTLKNARKTIVVSQMILNYLKTNFALNNIVWIPNGIDLRKYYSVSDLAEKEKIIRKLDIAQKLSKDNFIISYIGYMFFKQKVRGMINFLNAFSLFLDELSSSVDKNKIKLIFIGDGPFSPLLKNRIKNSRHQDSILFMGKRKDVEDFLAISDLCALTSYIEGNPNVILEAMASKVPCIGSDVGDIKFMIENTGFIVEPGNIEQIKQKILHYFELSKKERKTLGEEAYNKVKTHFSMERIIKRLLAVYEDPYQLNRSNK